MKRILILGAISLFGCSTAWAYQDGSGKSTTKKGDPTKNSGTKPENTKPPKTQSRTIEGTVIGTDGTKYWSGLRIESGGKEYTFVTEYNAGQGTNPIVIGRDCCLEGMRVRVTYTGSITRFLLNVTRIVTLGMTAAPPCVSAQPVETKIRAGDARPASLTVDLGNNVKLELMLIKAGNFTMGGDKYDRGNPPHRVTISQPFYLGKYEVTQTQWQALMGNNPSYSKNCGGNCPVEQVSWDDAQGFIKKLNERNSGYSFRLPTEAEWEYAARAGTTGDYAGKLDDMAWYGNNSGRCYLNVDEIRDSGKYLNRISNNGNQTHPVGMKQPNAWGLYDMHGNVYEWCQDWIDDNYYKSSPSADPQGPNGGQHRVLRGGAWDDGAYACRSAYRFSGLGFGNYEYGFRLVCVARTN